MKITKILTKTVASAIGVALMLSTVASASTIKTPNMGATAREYADLVSKAKIFGNLQDLAVYNFTGVCLSEAALDKAITNAKLAAEDVKRILFFDGDGKIYNDKRYYFWTTDDIIPYITDLGTVNKVSQELANASIGPIKLALKTEVSDDVKKVKPYPYLNNYPYYDRLYVLTSHDLFTAGSKMWIVDFDSKTGADVKTLDQVSTYFSDYATFLTSLKAFYKAAGCYTTTPTPPSNTTSKPGQGRPSRPSRPATPKRDAVITASNKTIKLGGKFSIMDGIKAMDDGGKGPNITNKVTVSGRVNTARAGVYRITYSVRGANGNLVNEVVRYTVRR